MACRRRAVAAGSGAFAPRPGSSLRSLLAPLSARRRGAAPSGRTRAVDDLAAPAVPELPPAEGPVVVWFKNDLRLSDHPGLLAALRCGAPQVIPFFCLDPELYCHLALTPAGPAALLAALARLRAQLRAAGSDLVVRLGPTHLTAAAFAGVTGADRIVLEREEESRWLEACHRLSQQLAAIGQPTRISTWQAPVWQQSSFRPNFRRWRAARGRTLEPLAAPEALPPLPPDVEPGHLPELSTLERLLSQQLAAAPASAPSRPGSPAAGRRSPAPAASAAWAAGRDAVLEQMLREPQALPHAGAAARLVVAMMAPGGGGGAAVASAPAPPLGPEELLEGYLVSEGMAPSQPQLAFLREAVAALETPAAPGASFPALLGPLLGLGVLSGREVHRLATRAEARRWGGRLPPLGPATPTAKAALAAVELADFHRQLAGHIPQEGDGGEGGGSGGWAAEPVASASSSFDEGPDGVQQWGADSWPPCVPRRCSWRWRGALTDYCVAKPAVPRPGAPALVLVHGFGAFGDQWRFNLGPLAEAGFEVYAPTLPGFGRSEKAALQYSQNAWRDFIRDFLVCVVRRPAVLAGNSIGGFISASAAADYPSLAAGLVLVNSAGPITPGFTAADAEAAAAASAAKRPPAAWFVRLSTMGLMAYLENSIAKQLKWLYPTNPDNADPWLEQEIYRAACDSRSPEVFASVFYLPRPRPLNFLVNELWKGPTAVVQGVLDPLNDADGRADSLAALCPGLRVWKLQAGHCPHDEVPGEVNAALMEFVERDVMGGGGGGDGEQQLQQQQPAVAAASGATK